MPYFDNVPKDKLKTEYRKLAQSMHPDKGGSTEKFQEMKREYEEREAGTYQKYAEKKYKEEQEEQRRKEAQKRKYDPFDDFDSYFKEAPPRPKPKPAPLKRNCRVNMREYLKGSVDVNIDGSAWSIPTNTMKDSYNLMKDGRVFVDCTMIYEIEELRIKVVEDNLSSVKGYVISQVYADEVNIGLYVVHLADTHNGMFKFEKSRVLRPLVDLSQWGVKKALLDIERYKTPDHMIAKGVDAFERFMYKLTK